VPQVQALLSQNASVNAPNDKGLHPIHLAAISTAASAELIALLLEWGAQVNAPNPHGSTAAHLAALRDNVQALDVLMLKEADINACDAQHSTPLNVAVSRNSLQAIGFLLELGADRTIADVRAHPWNRFVPLLTHRACCLALVTVLVRVEEEQRSIEECQVRRGSSIA